MFDKNSLYLGWSIEKNTLCVNGKLATRYEGLCIMV